MPPAAGGYVNALEVTAAQRTLFVSGQIPVSADGDVPEGAEAQCRQVWSNIIACLDSADMDVTSLVHVRTYLSDRSIAAVNTAVRSEVLGGHRPALTVVVAEIFDSQWLLEVEAVAMD